MDKHPPETVEDIGMNDEALIAFGRELIRIGTALCLHRDLTSAFKHPIDQSLLMLAAIELFQRGADRPPDIDYSWNPVLLGHHPKITDSDDDGFNYTICFVDPIPF